MALTKRYTAITGASAGIGYKTAIAFAKRAKNLIIIARRHDQLVTLRNEILAINPNLDVIIQVCDLTQTENVHQLYQTLGSYFIETWINNAGFGDYHDVAEQNLTKITAMIQLNIVALTLLSSLYSRDYRDQAGTQLINISSRGGYTLVPKAITYCATKFYVSAFTEGLAQELQATGQPMQAKVLAPAATQTEFGQIANDVTSYDYRQRFRHYHTSEEMAELLLKLYDSNEIVGEVDSNTFEFRLRGPIFAYSGNAKNNQS